VTSPLNVIAQTHNLWGDHHAAERVEALGGLYERRAPDLLATQETRAWSRDLLDAAMPGHDRVHDEFPGWERQSNLWWNRALFSEVAAARSSRSLCGFSALSRCDIMTELIPFPQFDDRLTLSLAPRSPLPASMPAQVSGSSRQRAAAKGHRQRDNHTSLCASWRANEIAIIVGKRARPLRRCYPTAARRCLAAGTA